LKKDIDISEDLENLTNEIIAFFQKNPNVTEEVFIKFVKSKRQKYINSRNGKELETEGEKLERNGKELETEGEILGLKKAENINKLISSVGNLSVNSEMYGGVIEKIKNLEIPTKKGEN
jgi:hypothetical protein